MEVAAAEAEVRRLVDEWLESTRTAVKAARDAAALSKIICGYIEMFPDLRSLAECGYFAEDGTLHEVFPGALEEPSPRGAEAVRRVLQEQPGYWWYISELVSKLREHGWLPDSDNPANAVRTACERLLGTDGSDVHKGRGTHTGKVVYSYRPDDEPFDGTIREINDPPTTGYDGPEEPF